MKLIFAGTPDFAERALSALHAAGHEIALVLSRPDQPAGRGQKLQASPVKQRALALDLPVAQPRTLRDPDAQALLAAVGADAMIVAAYGLILPPAVLAIPRLGCINIHASLLPRWRGAAPIHRAVEAGDAETGVTIMQMDEGLDTGDMLLVGRCPIHHDSPGADTTDTLHDRLAALGADLVVQALDLAAQGRLEARPQPAEGVTYARKVDKAEACLRWAANADVLERQVRAFHPAPGAWSQLDQQVIKVWRAQRGVADVPPGMPAGTVLGAGPAGIDVACGQGCLRITELQKPGGKRLAAAEFLRGFPVQPGMRFADAPAA